MSTTPHPRLYAIWALLLAFDVIIQVTMKIAGDQLGAIPFGLGWAAAALSSPMLWLSLVGYIATFVLWLAILHASPLSAAFPVTALVYVLVPLAGWLYLGEDFTLGQAAGIALIIAGVMVQRDNAKLPDSPIRAE
jgi:multidrug transporter EmrE-like cation transporter